jgi:hypothetical protein
MNMRNRFTKVNSFLRKKAYMVAAVVVSVASLAPLLSATPVQAAQITNRSMYLSNNRNNGAATAYSIQFDAPTTTIGSFEVAFCDTPLPGTVCNSPAGFALTSVAFAGTGGLKTGVPLANISDGTSGTNVTGFALGTAGNAPACGVATTTGTVLSTNTIPASGNSACGIRIAHSSAAQSFATANRNVWMQFTAVTNPTASGTFFARIATYGTNTYTTPLDTGSVAQSVRAQTNVTFRVQEILQVCAGGTPAISTATAIGTGNTCDATGITGYTTVVDLGVADPTSVSVTPVATGGATQGNAQNGFVMVRTNAANGASYQYRAVQDTSGTTNGELKVPGATCNANPSTSSSDPCINSVPVTQAGTSDIVAGTEEFGMSAFGVNRTSGASTAVTVDTNYDGTGTTGATCTPATGVNCWTWRPDGTAATIAASTAPIDDEAVLLKFAAASSLTTPTGAYQVNVDFFAVPTY